MKLPKNPTQVKQGSSAGFCFLPEKTPVSVAFRAASLAGKKVSHTSSPHKLYCRREARTWTCAC